MNATPEKQPDQIQDNLNSMQKWLESLKASIEKDVTIATNKECVSLMKNIISTMALVRSDNAEILTLKDALDKNPDISQDVLDKIIAQFIDIQLDYTANKSQTTTDNAINKYNSLLNHKSWLDALLSSINTSSYTIQDPVEQEPEVDDQKDPLLQEPTTEDEKSWLQKQTSALFSKEEWKKDWKTNSIRAVSWLAIVWWAAWGIKKLWSWFSGWDKEKEKESSDKKDDSKEGMSRWKKWLLALWGVGVGRWLWKNKDKISEWLWFSEKLSFDDALKKVQWDINNISEVDIKSGIWEITYNETSKEIQSYKNVGTKIDKSNKKIPWLNVEFSDYEQMIFTANFINYLKYRHKWKWVNNSPFFVGQNGGNIYMKTTENGKEKDQDVLSWWFRSTLADFAPDIDGWAWKKALSLIGLKDNKWKEKLVAYLNGLDIWQRWDSPNQENPNNDPVISETNDVHDDIRNTIHDLEQHGITRWTIQAEKVPDKDAYDIQSWNWSTRIELASWWKYLVEGMGLVLPVNEAIRVANLANKMKSENQNKWRSAAPFSYERERWKRWLYIDLKDSPNRTSTKMRVLTNDAIEKTLPTIHEWDNEKYLVDYLNSIKNEQGNSFWI